jgi:hypothetical protein
MGKWIGGGFCCIVLLAFVYFQSLNTPLEGWAEMGHGLTEMFAPFALIGLLVLFYPKSKNRPKT